jgi:hypothetical protein
MQTYRHFVAFLILVLTVELTAQSLWDDYVNVASEINAGQIDLPEAENYKITIGPNKFPIDKVQKGDEWVYYLIHWSLTPSQLNSSFVLRDTFDSYLDGSSVVMLASSNSYQISSMSKQIFAWSVSSLVTDEETKEGHVYFKVRLTKDIPIGTVIRNTAAIHLQNGDIITTTTAAIIVTDISSTNDTQVADNQIIAPNPNHGKFSFTHAQLGAFDKVEVFNAFGKSISTLRQDQEIVVAETVNSGMYFLRLTKWRTNFVTVLPFQIFAP